MSYFNQRKKEERTDKVLFYGLIFIAIFSFLGFFIQDIASLSFMNDLRFLYIVLCFFVVFISPFFERWLSFLVSLILLSLNLVTVHSSTSLASYGGSLGKYEVKVRVLFDDNADSFLQDYKKLSKQNIDMLFLNFKQKGKDFVQLDSSDYKFRYLSNKASDTRSMIYSKTPASEAGQVILSKEIVASWVVLNIKQTPYLFINLSSIDRNDVFKKSNKNYLDNLAKFINSRDERVILVANTGFVAWSKKQREFMNKTSLSVRSGVTLNNNQSKFKLLRKPTTNVYAFNKLEFDNIDLVENELKESNNDSIIFDFILP